MVNNNQFLLHALDQNGETKHTSHSYSKEGAFGMVGKHDKGQQIIRKGKTRVFVQARQPEVSSEFNSSIIPILESYHCHISIGRARDGTYTRRI